MYHDYWWSILSTEGKGDGNNYSQPIFLAQYCIVRSWTCRSIYTDYDCFIQSCALSRAASNCSKYNSAILLQARPSPDQFRILDDKARCRCLSSNFAKHWSTMGQVWSRSFCCCSSSQPLLHDVCILAITVFQQGRNSAPFHSTLLQILWCWTTAHLHWRWLRLFGWKEVVPGNSWWDRLWHGGRHKKGELKNWRSTVFINYLNTIYRKSSLTRLKCSTNLFLQDEPRILHLAEVKMHIWHEHLASSTKSLLKPHFSAGVVTPPQ